MYIVTVFVQHGEDYTFNATDDEIDLEYQDTLVRICEEAGIETSDVINVTSEYEPDEDEDEDEDEETSREFEIGDQFTLSEDALENYGEEYRDVVFTVRQWFDHSCKPSEVGTDTHGHPGFDGANSSDCLYETTNDPEFPGALYSWEMESV